MAARPNAPATARWLRDTPGARAPLEVGEGLALVLTVLVAAGTELARVTPTAKQVCCAKVSACWRSLPVHEDWMHWVVEETKAGLLQRHLLSLLAHPPRLALVRQVSPHAGTPLWRTFKDAALAEEAAKAKRAAKRAKRMVVGSKE